MVKNKFSRLGLTSSSLSLSLWLPSASTEQELEASKLLELLTQCTKQRLLATLTIQQPMVWSLGSGHPCPELADLCQGARLASLLISLALMQSPLLLVACRQVKTFLLSSKTSIFASGCYCCSHLPLYHHVRMFPGVSRFKTSLIISHHRRTGKITVQVSFRVQ